MSGVRGVGLATVAAVDARFEELVGGAPGALDTLNEIAAALAEDDSVVAASRPRTGRGWLRSKMAARGTTAPLTMS